MAKKRLKKQLKKLLRKQPKKLLRKQQKKLQRKQPKKQLRKNNTATSAVFKPLPHRKGFLFLNIFFFFVVLVTAKKSVCL